MKDADAERVGRRFSGAATELALAGYPGLHLTAPPTAGYRLRRLLAGPGAGRPGRCPRSSTPTVGGWPSPTPPTGSPSRRSATGSAGRRARAATGRRPRLAGRAAGRHPRGCPWAPSSAPVRATRGATPTSGCGPARDQAWAWLDSYLTIERFRTLLPEADGLEIRRHAFPNLRALNFVVVGLLGEGVASSTRPDPQAKGLGEYLRSRVVDIPVGLLTDRGTTVPEE